MIELNSGTADILNITYVLTTDFTRYFMKFKHKAEKILICLGFIGHTRPYSRRIFTLKVQVRGADILHGQAPSCRPPWGDGQVQG